jgi:hypothetical protein
MLKVSKKIKGFDTNSIGFGKSNKGLIKFDFSINTPVKGYICS